MQVDSGKAGTPVGFVFAGALGVGLSFGVIKSLNLGLVANLASALSVLAIQWAIYSRGKSSAWAQAQAWAQNEVNIAIEVTNTAISKANALSEAYASAIATAHANATNEVTINMPEQKSLEDLLREGADQIAERFSESTGMAEQEFTTQKH
jgi:hypothetical protein